MRKLAAGAVLVLVVLVLAAPAADAATLGGGCKGLATSSDKGGNKLDSASAPGSGGSKSDPFLVDADGTVDYQGTTPTVFHDHSWHVDVSGIAVKSGGANNGTNQSSTSGTEKIDEYVPLKIVGLYRVSGGITAGEGACNGSAWIKVVGSPVGTVGWIAGVVLTVLGGAGIVRTVMPLLRRGG